MQSDEKKEIYIGPTIQHIQSSEFLIKHQNNLLLQNKRQLFLLNLQTQSIITSKIDSERVSSATVHQILNIYLVKTQNDIFVVNEAGQSLGKIRLQDQIALMSSRFIFILAMEDGQCEDPHQRIDKLIYITDENLHISDIKITFERAILKNKRITQFMFQLLKPIKNNQIDPTIVFDAPEWIEKCKIFKDFGYFVCYNTHELMVFSLPKIRENKIQLYLTYRKTSKSQNLITDVAISLRQKQIIFSHISGVIKIYRFNQTKKYLQELRGHQKQCHSLFISSKNNNDILYSSGYDNTIRIWNLYQFEEIYSLRIDLIVDDIVLLSDQLAFLEWSNSRKSCLCKINAYKMEPIMTENKGGKIVNLKSDGEWGIVLYSNNYAEMFLTDDQPQKQQLDPLEEINGNKLKNYIEKIQFPLKYGNVISAKKIRKNQYAIILEKGFSMITLNKDEIISQNFELKKLVYNEQIANFYSDSQASQEQIDQIYNVHQEKQKQNKIRQIKHPEQIRHQAKNDNRLVELIHQKLLGTYLFGILEDWKGIPTAINVTFVTFVTGKSVPMWDMEQKKKVASKINNNQEIQKTKKKKSFIEVEENEVKAQDMVHVVLGTDRGVIFIVDIQNRVQFESRIAMHTGAISYIKEFFPKFFNSSFLCQRSDEIFFMSLDNSKQICFWSLSEHHPPNIYCRVTNQREITHLSLHGEYLLVGEKEGKVSVLQIVWQELKEENNALKSFPLSSALKRKDSKVLSMDSNHHRPSKLYFRVSNNQSLYGHMKKVTTGDYLCYKQKNLFITGSEDCIIKLWLGLEKILLFELKIFDTIEHIRFLHSGIDFLMAHHDQVSVIKAKNIYEIQQIQNELDSKYLQIPFFGMDSLPIKSFFNKENQILKNQPKKPSNFRLKMKNSLKIQPVQKIIPDTVYKTELDGLGVQLKDIKEVPQKNQKEGNEQDFPTKFKDKQIEPSKFFSPEKKIITEQQMQNKLKVYAKSEQKIKARKSFHVANTAESKEYNDTYFMLPKIMSKNPANVNRKKASTSFQSSLFLEDLKSQRQKAYSYFARYSQK